MKQIYVGDIQRSKLFTKVRKTVLVPHIIQVAVFILLIIIPLCFSGSIFSEKNMRMSNVVQIVTPKGKSGSAVLVSNDKLLSCAHVFQGMKIDDLCSGLFVNPDNLERPAVCVTARLIAIGNYFQHSNLSEDYALLQIVESDMPIDRITTPCALGKSKDISVKENITIIGYPGGDYFVTQGVVGNLNGGNMSNHNCIAVDARAWKGNSGGAILNGKDELIAIVAKIGLTNEYNDGQTYALKIDWIREALQKKGFQL